MLPFNLCRVVLAGGYAVGAVVPSMRGIVRRVELMWMGQEQDAAWSRSVEVDRNHYVAEVLGQNEPSAQ